MSFFQLFQYCLGSGKRTIGDFISEQLLHAPPPPPLPPVSAYCIFLNTENIAAGKLTNQSSTYKDKSASGESSKAVDGNSDTHFPNGHCSHTLTDNPSWWSVDLGSDHLPVFEVRIVNRFSTSDSIRQRNNGYKITLGE